MPHPCRPIYASLVVLILIFATKALAGDGKVSIDYDSFSKPEGYTLLDYSEKWTNISGPRNNSSGGGETRSFADGGFTVSAVPFTVGFDSVFDHRKYLAISTRVFPPPPSGSITFSSVIEAETPGTQPGRIIEGSYIQGGAPFAMPTFEGQQAAATLHMIDFATGQVFDWFISGSRALTLVERVPSSITNPKLPASDPAYVGRNKMYTHIIDEVPAGPGPHTVAIKFTRKGGESTASYFLDGRLISRIRDIGVPLDVQGMKYTGIYPSVGPGEKLAQKISGLVIGHGLFSLLDAFPFQHPESPELAVSVPLENRLFGQGVRATFRNFRVDIDPGDDDVDVDK